MKHKYKNLLLASVGLAMAINVLWALVFVVVVTLITTKRYNNRIDAQETNYRPKIWRYWGLLLAGKVEKIVRKIVHIMVFSLLMSWKEIGRNWY